MLTKLEERGLVVRTLDPGDRRRVLIELTSQGRRSLEGHRVFSGTSLVLAARSLSAGERLDLIESVDKLVRAARELEAGDSFG
jgi:DNA-binding MarR family transcriptional regulator